MLNLSNLGTTVSAGLDTVLTQGIDLLRKVYQELFRNEDILFEKYFKTEFMPSLYDIHTAEQSANCIFCSRLETSSCHKHCLKCSKGTYIRCSPLLPGILCYEDTPGHSSEAPLPWLYKEPCRHFARLNREIYYKNLLSHTSWIRLYNFEVLEGLSNGLVTGERPCHICAAVDYEIYKDCLMAGETCTDSPCYKISGMVSSKIIQAAC
jgi:hypothetical protein